MNIISNRFEIVENDRVNVVEFSNRVKRVENHRVNMIFFFIFSSRVKKLKMIE